MRIERFEVPGLAHYSYLIVSAGCAAVIDPRRDIDVYLDYAAARDLKITHVLETHIHADYASGARELVEDTGAEAWLSGHDEGEDFQYRFPHRDFRDGEELDLGEARVVAMHTPGHTPEHLAFLVYERGREHPLALLSGDFVFVGSLGRPDLLGEAAKHRLAGELYQSVHERLKHLPDGVQVLPAHGAGSLCGAGMGERPFTTLGYERASNIFFGMRSREEFIDTILRTVPPFPEYYKRMKRVNSEGAKPLGGIPDGGALAPEDFETMIEKKNAVVIDLRRPEAFGGAHVPGAFSIGGDQNLSMWAAWVVPYDKPILLVGEENSDCEAARRSLIRVGLDDICGYLRGGMRSWILEGYPQEHVPQISVYELAEKMRGGGASVLDVRTAGEWNSGHVQGATHIMAGELPQRLSQVPRDREVYLVCGSGYRSSVASSVLRRAGYESVHNVIGGMTAWKAAGLPVVTEQAACAA
jgi:hydroxyacylglutathione hydrolase